MTEKNEATKIIDIALVCHETNRAYCVTLGDHSQVPWDEAPEWQRQSAIDGVRFAFDNPNSPPSASHENWLKDKEKDGWKYGPVKNPEAKEHPCMVSYDHLPLEQRIKDHLFQGVVKAMLTAA